MGERFVANSNGLTWWPWKGCHDSISWEQALDIQKFLATKRRHAVIIAASVGISLVPATVLGQSGGRKVIRLEAIKVEGRIQKPQAFYILQRSNLNFEGLELKQSFIPKILSSVAKKPF